MKLHCNKCNTIVTKDLYRLPNKKSSFFRDNKSDDPEDDAYNDCTISPIIGTYTEYKKVKKVVDYYDIENPHVVGRHFQVYKYPAVYNIHKQDTLSVPDYVTGCGCCDYDGMGSDSDYKCHCCGEVLGTMHYDCWLTFKRTEFLVSKTHFENK